MIASELRMTGGSPSWGDQTPDPCVLLLNPVSSRHDSTSTARPTTGRQSGGCRFQITTPALPPALGLFPGIAALLAPHQPQRVHRIATRAARQPRTRLRLLRAPSERPNHHPRSRHPTTRPACLRSARQPRACLHALQWQESRYTAARFPLCETRAGGESASLRHAPEPDAS